MHIFFILLLGLSINNALADGMTFWDDLKDIDLFTTDYKSIVEIIDENLKESYIVEEYKTVGEKYDWQNSATGALVIKTDKTRRHSVYIPAGGLISTIDMNDHTTLCENKFLNGTESPISDIPSKLQWQWVHTAGEFTTVGPISMLMNFQHHLNLESTSKSDDIEANKNRGASGTLFTAKLNSGQFTIKVFGENYKSDNWTGIDESNNRTHIISVHLEGEMKSDGKWSGQHSGVKITYNFLFYTDDLHDADRRKLQMPEGRNCRGSSLQFTTPRFDDYQLDGEIFLKDVTKEQRVPNISKPLILTNFQIKYLTSSNTFEITQNMITKHDSKYISTGSMTNIMLMDKGYHYIINNAVSKCDIQRDVDKMVTFFLPDGTSMHFTSIDKLLYFGDFKYLGNAVIRGIKTRVFEKMMEPHGTTVQFSELYGLELSVIITIYEENIKSNDTPVRMEIRVIRADSKKIKKIEKLVVFNLYDYSTISGELNGISIEDCVSEQGDSLWFQMTYEKSRGYVPPEDIIVDFENKLTLNEDISPLRIRNTNVTYQLGTIRITSELIERPKAIVDFSEDKTNVTAKNVKDFAIVKNFVLYKEDCARMCLMQYSKGIPCLSFVYCDLSCYMYFKKDTPKLKTTDYKPTCSFYSRLNGMKQGEMKFNDQILADIDFSLQESGLDNIDDLSMTYYNRRGDEITVKPTSLTTDLPWNPKSNSKSMDISKSFKYVIRGYTFKSEYIQLDYSGSGLNMKSCAHACKSESTFMCESYVYCPLTQSCLLSTSHPLRSNFSYAVVIQSDCALFARNSLDNYKAYKGYTLTTIGTEVGTLAYEDECADICTSNKIIDDCKSFDYCHKNSKYYCILHKTHFFDVQKKSDLKYDNECTHYSKLFYLDYKKRSHLQLKNQYVVATFTNTSLEQCSKLCSDHPTCKSYDLCSSAGSRLCHLSGSVDNIKNITTQSNYCSFYGQIYDKDGNYVGPMPSTGAQKAADGVTKGAVGGVVAGMIILGLLLGAVLIFVYKKRTD